MHVLLVEDNPADAHLFRIAVEPITPRVHLSVAEEAGQALAFLSSHEPYIRDLHPDVIFLDLRLSGMNGFELLAALKQDPALHCLPTIVWTISADPFVVTRCRALGANAYLVRPSDWKTYCTVVRTAISFWSTCQFRMLAH